MAQTPVIPKDPKLNFLKVVKGKKVLFLENDNGLYHGLDSIEKLLLDNGVEYNAIFSIREVALNEVINQINSHDVIIFQTQWVYSISQEIREYAFKMKDKKIFIECYIAKPTWYHKPKVIHDVYIVSAPDKYQTVDWMMEWTFCKLSKKAYWEYKNQFDK